MTVWVYALHAKKLVFLFLITAEKNPCAQSHPLPHKKLHYSLLQKLYAVRMLDQLILYLHPTSIFLYPLSNFCISFTFSQQWIFPP